MFYQTYTARKAAEITPGQRRNGAICHCVSHLQPARSIPSSPVVMGVDSAFFVPGDLDL